MLRSGELVVSGLNMFTEVGECVSGEELGGVAQPWHIGEVQQAEEELRPMESNMADESGTWAELRKSAGAAAGGRTIRCWW